MAYPIWISDRGGVPEVWVEVLGVFGVLVEHYVNCSVLFQPYNGVSGSYVVPTHARDWFDPLPTAHANQADAEAEAYAIEHP